MAGDSITAQHLHSNYFEAFCFARYPQAEVRLPQFRRRRPHHSQHAGPLRLRHRRLEADRGLGRAGHERPGRHADREVRGQHGHDGRTNPRHQGPAGDLLGQPDQQRRHAGQTGRQQAAARLRRRPEGILRQGTDSLRRPVPRPARRLGQEQAERDPGQLDWAALKQLAAGRRAGGRRAPAGLPGRPGQGPDEARLDAGRPGASRAARPTDDGGRTC